MVRCAMYGCNSTNNLKNPSKLNFFRFPKDARICDLWVEATKRSDKFNTQTAKICSKHFLESDYDPSVRTTQLLKQQLLNYSPSRTFRLLKPKAVPTQNIAQTGSTSSISCKKRCVPELLNR